MKELVVLSGKGGTGKTSITAAFAMLADRPVLCDCDVNAADLHLILGPNIREHHEFRSGHEALIRPEICIGCGTCAELCRFAAVKEVTNKTDAAPAYTIDPVNCEGCGVCVRFCPAQAIAFPEKLCGQWYVSDTRCGPMVHARLNAAAENSGKLVTTVRQEARRIATEKGNKLIIVDGPPGIGCPVIASLTGASIVLIVTEPTVSGEHDMERVLALTKHFSIPTAVCVNKSDLNMEKTEQMEKRARLAQAQVIGRISYDAAFIRAQIQKKTVVETDAPCAIDIRKIWNNLNLQEV